MGRAERLALIGKIQDLRKSKLICYLTSDRPNASSEIGKDAMPLFYEHLRGLGDLQKVDVLIVTLGGDVLAGFGLARQLHEFSHNVGILVPEKCYSAGTLFALGGSEIIMTKGATLGPIDPSVVRPLNPVVEITPGQRQLISLSVESVAGFKNMVTDDWGIKGEESLSIMMKLLAERVHPLALGDVYRSRQQIELLATKLLTSHRSDSEEIKRIAQTLTKGYGSHDYLISRSEARELLGSQVAADNTELEDAMWDLYSDYATEMQLNVPFDVATLLNAQGASNPSGVLQKRAIIESICCTHTAETDLRLSSVQINTPGLQQKILQQEVTRNAWVKYS